MLRVFSAFLLGIGVSMLYQSEYRRKMDLESRFGDLADRLNSLALQSRALLGETRGELTAAMRERASSMKSQVGDQVSGFGSQVVEQTANLRGQVAEQAVNLSSQVMDRAASLGGQVREQVGSVVGLGGKGADDHAGAGASSDAPSSTGESELTSEPPSDAGAATRSATAETGPSRKGSDRGKRGAPDAGNSLRNDQPSAAGPQSKPREG
ncbi:MAG: hypothetical protein HY329_05975 [Chloroflexi bacterium]|nr:hypothetical protein [Chloroflexota bacterium]